MLATQSCVLAGSQPQSHLLDALSGPNLSYEDFHGKPRYPADFGRHAESGHGQVPLYCGEPLACGANLYGKLLKCDISVTPPLFQRMFAHGREDS